MNRRDNSPCGVVMAVVCLFVGASSGNAAESGSPQRPNIVLVVADDLGYGSLGCYGSTEIDTPHIDRLAVRGVRMTDFHANGPMCAPTRAALLTGRYQQRCAWVDDAELSPPFREQRRANPKQRWAWGISTGEVTLPELLRDAGYATGLCGKWHLGYDLAFHPLHHGFYEFRGYVGGAVDYHTHVATHGLRELDWWNGSTIAHEEGYSTDLLTRYATDFIERHRNEPFFLELTHGAPHTPLPGTRPGGDQAAAGHLSGDDRGTRRFGGAVVDTLEACGLTERTIVVFCSDNGAAPPKGIAANGRLRGRKGDLFEGGHRVPCIVVWPGRIPAGDVAEAPA